METTSQAERPLTRQEIEDALAKRRRGIHMMKDAIKLRELRDEYQDFKKFCDSEKERLKSDRDQASDDLDRLAFVAEIAACGESAQASDVALSAIQKRVKQLLNPEKATD